MKKSLLLTLALLASATSALAATQSVYDFSDLANPNNALFSGSWSDGNGGAGTGSTQGSGVFVFSGVSNTSSDTLQFFFDTPLDLTTVNTMSLTAQLGAGNTATSLIFGIIDDNFLTEEATFDLSAFNSSSFTTQTVTLVQVPNFEYMNTAGFGITGNDAGLRQLDIVLNQLDVGTSAVPEPSTYAAIAGTAVLLGTMYRTRRRRRLAPA